MKFCHLQQPKWTYAALEQQVDQKRYPTSNVSSSSLEETAHVQGKRNPSKTVGAEREHQRADRLKPQSQKTSQSDHTDHSLV